MIEILLFLSAAVLIEYLFYRRDKSRIDRLRRRSDD